MADGEKSAERRATAKDERTGEASGATDTNAVLLKIAQTMSDAMAAMQAMALPKDAIRDIMAPIVKEVGDTVSRARWPENTEHPHISVYFTEADRAKYGDWTKKPTLTRETFFNGAMEKEDQLTPSEIEMYNAIREPRSVRGGAWRAELHLPTSQGAQAKLFVWVPAASVDQRMMLPSLQLILHELNGGPSTENVMGLLEQIDQLKRQLAKAKGTTVDDLERQLIAGTL